MDLHEIVQSRAAVSALLKSQAGGGSGGVKQWISPHESHLNVFEFTFLDEPSAITSLVDLHKSIFTHRKYNVTSSNQRQKLFLKFDNAELPDSTPPRPSLSEVRSIVETGELFMAIYSLEGYNFSLEFSHVYGGENSIDTSFSDLIAVFTRAVRAVDPSVSADQAQTYAEYIIRVATWEVQIANATCMSTLETYFPSLKAKVMEKVKFSVPSIYIGMGDDMNLCFWVRLCPSIESTSDDIGELREIDKQYEKHTSFCYYRRYPISPEICEELDLAGFADSTTGDEKAHEFDATDKTLSVEKTKHMPGAILPPPKKPKQHEIFVAMLVRNSSEIDSQTQEDMDDIAFSVENEFEEGISNSIMYETEAMSGVDSPRKANIKSRLGQAQASGEGGGSASGNGTGKMDRLQISDVTNSWTSNSSPFAEIYGWGRNTAYLFDKNKEKIADRGASMLTPDADKQMEDHDTNYVCFNPTAISIPPSIHLERIRMIACSPTHMLVLTYNGSVYSCGDNTEGALGLGDTKNRQSLDLVLWPTLARENLDEEDADAKAKVDKQRNVVCISAGAAAIGSHSMAITESGDLYGWGVAYASGHGTAKKSITSPQKIFMPQPQEVINALREKAKAEKEAVRRAGGDVATEEPELPDEEMTAAEMELRRSREIEAAGSAPVKHVACGGGFTVAVLECGYVASWGMWSHGRLGLGPPPKIEGETKKSRGRNKKKVVRYQLRPRLIPALKHVVKVSCGEAHALCVTRRGRVYAWGQNSCGQVGNGPTPSGFLRDAMEPTLVTFLRDPSHEARLTLTGQPTTVKKMKIIDVCAGTFHSLAKDAEDGVWSWGGRGDVCLGHNDPPISGTWASRVSAVFSPSTNYQKILVPFELMNWCAVWSRPRHIRSLTVANNEEKIVQLTAGDMHSGFLFSSGRFYLCGSGPVVPPIIVHKEKAEEELDEGADEDEGKTNEDNIDEAVAEMSDRMVTVSTPRCPSAMWLYKVSTRVSKYLCSAGTFMVVVQDEDLISASLTQKLLRQTTNNPVVSLTADSLTEGAGSSLTSGSTSVKKTILPPTGRGKPDCLLIVAGRILVAHRGLLSMRCSVLREKLIEEAPVDDGLEGSIFTPTQVLLPDLVTETGRALHTFLYTGVLPPKCVRDTLMIKNLLDVGRKFRLPRLIVACDRLVKIHEAASQSLLSSYEDDVDDDDSDDETSLLEKSRRIRVDSSKKNFIHSVFSDLNLELPPSTLGRDLGSLVGDSQYADVRFIAEGRSLSAHRFILEARCEYFRVLFNSGLSESLHFQKTPDGDPDNEIPAVVDIVVPDTFVGLLRLLIFLYTDVLPDGADGALLEDLMSADRYQVHDLKRLCESMLIPSHDNWIDLLRAATLFNSPQLEVDVLAFLRDNVEDVMKVKDMGISEEFPNLLSQIMEIRRSAYPLPPAQGLVTYTNHVAKESKEKREQFHMPYWAIAAGLVAAFTYQHVIRVVSLGVLVPVVNVVMFMGVMYYFYYVMLNE